MAKDTTELTDLKNILLKRYYYFVLSSAVDILQLIFSTSRKFDEKSGFKSFANIIQTVYNIVTGEDVNID